VILTGIEPQNVSIFGKYSSKISQTLHLFAQQTLTGEERRLGTNLPV
jgi:hypothetical protein